MRTPDPPETFSPTWAPPGGGHPTVVGDYRILGILGTGGMGTVYAAEQEHPHRTVALKVIRSEFASEDAIRRFARESEVLARLQHPGIAQVYASGNAGGPYGSRPFFAMELVRGRQLTDYVQAECRDLAKRLELFAHICDAVQYAHQRGVIHRDLKPANILVDEAGHPKILDFGVARLTESDNPATFKTDIGVVVGTLQYMSPEQVAGDPLDVDTRSDIYALGVILFELLSQQLPYTWKAGGIAQAAHVIVTSEPPSLGSIDRRFRGDIETIVAKALEKDKTRRYASAAGLASDVRRHLRDEPISARPASAAYQLRKLARRHRALFTGLGIAAFALVAGTAVSVAMAVRARAAERLAVDEAAKAVAVSRFLEDMLQSTNPDLTQGRNLTIKDVVDRAARELAGGRLAAQPTVRADVHVTLGKTYFAVAAYDSALAHLDSAYAIRRRTLGPTHASTVEAALEGAHVVNDQRDVPGSERRYRAALDAARRVQPPRPDLIVEATTRLALLAQLGQRQSDADSLGKVALALARQARLSDSIVIGAVQTLAEIHTFARDEKDAEPLWREVVEYNRRHYGERNTYTLNTVYGLAYNLFQQGKYSEAEALLRPALPVMRSVYGDHPFVANVLDRLGNAVMRQGRLEEAEPLLRESLAMRLKVLGERHSDVQLSRTNLARLLQAGGRYAEAKSLFTDALRTRTAVYGARNGTVSSSMDDLAGLAVARGDLPEAIRLYRAEIPIWRAAELPQYEQMGMSNLANALTLSGELDEAQRLLVDVRAKERARGGEPNADVAATVYRLGEVARRRGRLAEADSIHREALAMRRQIFGATSIRLVESLAAMAAVRQQMGDTASAEPFLRELVDVTRAVRPATDTTLLQRQVWLGATLCAMGKTTEGEKIARDVLASTSAAQTAAVARARRTVDTCVARARR